MKSLIIFLTYVVLTPVTLSITSIEWWCPKEIISKARWGGRAAKNTENALTPWKYVIIHHTATPACTNVDDCSKRLIDIQNYHMNEMTYDDISYNFLIGGDGNVYAGTGWHNTGSHAGGKSGNRKSFGIAFIGDFSAKLPTEQQLTIAKKFIQCAVELEVLDKRYKLLGARSVKNTESPGDVLYKEIHTWEGFVKRSLCYCNP